MPPETIADKSTTIKVSRVKGKLLPGTSRSIKFDKDFTGIFKDGWRVSSDRYDRTPGGMFSEEAIKRSFLLNFGIGINDVVSKTSDKFQFNIAQANQSLLVFCHQMYLGKSKSYQIRNTIDYSRGERQASNFTASMYLEKDTLTKPWLLNLAFDRETPGGIIATTLREGMAVESGFITNQKDTIYISPLFINNATSAKGTYAMPFQIVGGYEFKRSGQSIGWVDLYSTTIGFAESIIQNDQLLVVASSTAILLRNR